MPLKISSEWNVVARLADDFAVQDLALAAFHAATSAYAFRAQCSSCVTDFARWDGCKDSGRNWRCASWLLYRFRNLKDADADCVCGWVRRRVIAHFNRGTANRSAVRNGAQHGAHQFPEPERDCGQVKSFEDISMCFEEC